MDEETQKAVAWLNSPAGRRWSYLKHRQSSHAKSWFSFKRDVESPWSSTYQGSPDWDDFADVRTVDLGWYNPESARYCRGPRWGMQPYRKRGEDVPR
jgi:hypothetical protein